MGIPGLTTYIANRSERYLESFDLHNTQVVIDGSSLQFSLYCKSKCNCAFGGDYDVYAQCIREFFQGLKDCNIKPLVLPDGGSEEKKLQTVMKRVLEKMKKAESYTPLSQDKEKLFPILLSDVFKSIMREMGIKHVQCLFEADNSIAAVAEFLNCPVLSNDSDFYIYGTLYIPFNTMDIYVTKKCRNNVKCCKIYRVTNLLNSFPGLDRSLLPLAAILLGNDYIEQNFFTNFYQCITLPRVEGLSRNQCRIEGVLYWLSKHTLNSAITIIMSYVPQHEKKQTLSVIKMIMNEYTNLSTDILIPLGFSKEDIISKRKQSNCNIQTDTNYNKVLEELEKIIETINPNEDMVGCSKSKTISETFVNSLPTWFINESYKGLFPSYFKDIMMGGFYICHVQNEDNHQPSSIFISNKIINVIFTLLKSGFRKENECPKYITRGAYNMPTQYPLEYTGNIFSSDIPSLHDLREVPLYIRREIMNVTLGVQEHMHEFPLKWQLYIATIKYWINHLTNVTSDCHIYALLFAILHHIIEVKIGCCRSIDEFKSRYQKKLEELEFKKKTSQTHFSYSTDMSIIEAFYAVEMDDCLLLAPFFINNSEMDSQLYINPKMFNVSFVHIFAQFQSCLKHSLNLNALLGFPYEPTLISDMFNGTLLYNLYNDFKIRNNIEDYINLILECSPTLLQLFNIILIKAKLMFKIRAIPKTYT